MRKLTIICSVTHDTNKYITETGKLGNDPKYRWICAIAEKASETVLHWLLYTFHNMMAFPPFGC